MIKPSEVKTGRNIEEKTRHAEICTLFLDENLSMESIAAKIGITRQAVHYVLHNNKEILKLDKDFEKLMRVNLLKRILTKTPEDIAKGKDATDVAEQLRKEFEGDKQSLNLFQQFFQIEPDASVKNRLNEIQT